MFQVYASLLCARVNVNYVVYANNLFDAGIYKALLENS